MIHLFFVGDGPRDGAMLPPLVERILGAEVGGMFREWGPLHLRGRGGYGGKLQFLIRAARDAGVSGVVAVVDRDKNPQRRRLRDLAAGRAADRTAEPPFPTALGEAVPHVDAWLLDDHVAVRRGLKLAAEIEIHAVRQTTDPKGSIQSLVQQSETQAGDLLAILAGIAREVVPARCQHAKETGFKKFADDVRRELGPLVPKV
jgi:hypothetical protein